MDRVSVKRNDKAAAWRDKLRSECLARVREQRQSILDKLRASREETPAGGRASLNLILHNALDSRKNGDRSLAMDYTLPGPEYEELMQSLEEALWQDATALGHNECDYLDDLEAAEMEASWQAAEAEGSTPTPCPCCGYHALYCGPGGRVSCKACHLDLQVASLEALRELLAVVLQEHWQRGCNHTPSFQAHRSQAGESTRLWARCQGCGMRVQVL
ncbi:hypothetical protein ACKKBF_B33195 [Auxenochlorella protothecoides x Auxenochlorella symbiontica]